MRNTGTNPEKVVENEDASTDIASKVMNMGQYYVASFHAIFSNGAALAGTLAVQGSNDPEQAATSWDNVSTQVVAANAPLKKLFNIEAIGYRYARIIWTRTGGTGNLDVFFDAKG